eukprot:SAG22_NODE_1528_length_4218_cov_30.416363_2_plen_228_part_00
MAGGGGVTLVCALQVFHSTGAYPENCVHRAGQRRAHALSLPHFALLMTVARNVLLLFHPLKSQRLHCFHTASTQSVQIVRGRCLYACARSTRIRKSSAEVRSSAFVVARPPMGPSPPAGMIHASSAARNDTDPDISIILTHTYSASALPPFSWDTVPYVHCANKTGQLSPAFRACAAKTTFVTLEKWHCHLPLPGLCAPANHGAERKMEATGPLLCIRPGTIVAAPR